MLVKMHRRASGSCWNPLFGKADDDDQRYNPQEPTGGGAIVLKRTPAFEPVTLPLDRRLIHVGALGASVDVLPVN